MCVVDLQTPASIRQLNRTQVSHHLLLPGLSQRDLGNVACDEEAWEAHTHRYRYTQTLAEAHTLSVLHLNLHLPLSVQQTTSAKKMLMSNHSDLSRLICCVLHIQHVPARTQYIWNSVEWLTIVSAYFKYETQGHGEDDVSYLATGREALRSPPPSGRPQPGGACRSASLSELHPRQCGQQGNMTQTWSVEERWVKKLTIDIKSPTVTSTQSDILSIQAIVLH